MNSRELEEKLKEINIEDFIWVIYIFIILMSWYSNSKERHYFIYKDEKSKEEYRCLVVMIFTILLVVYLYFVKSSWDSYKELKNSSDPKTRELAILSLLASLLIAISGAVFLYIAIKDDKLAIELAFN